MGITAQRLRQLSLVDQIVQEPLGGAHRDTDLMAARLKSILLENVERLKNLPLEVLLENRYNRLMSYGIS